MRIYRIEVLPETFDKLFPDDDNTGSSAQAVICESCGGNHALHDCPLDTDDIAQEENDYFGFTYNKPLRF